MTGPLLGEDRPRALCDVCDEPIDGDPCEPHWACLRIDHGNGDCDCDYQVHPACCWTCHPVAQAVGR